MHDNDASAGRCLDSVNAGQLGNVWEKPRGRKSRWEGGRERDRKRELSEEEKRKRKRARDNSGFRM